MKAARRQTTSYTPVWFMRQAGRYQPEYRQIREKYTLPQIVRRPELTAEVTLLPVENFGFDAAILFADITTPLYGMGFQLDIVEGRGPVIDNPIMTDGDVNAVRQFSAERDTPFVLDAIKILKGELRVPLIGFSGAPFTLASYLLEGGPSKNFIKLKRFIYSRPETWSLLMDKLVKAMVDYLTAQVNAGADALQIFDSWVGRLSRHDYQRYVAPHMHALFEELAQLGVPLIHFGTQTMHLLEPMSAAGGDVIGVDTTTPLNWARNLLGERAVQGNLDPSLLFAPRNILREGIIRVLNCAGDKPGHIFNLGHGVLPGTDPDAVAYAVDQVHSLSGGAV